MSFVILLLCTFVVPFYASYAQVGSKVLDSTTEASAPRQGSSVAVSSDGLTMVVGARDDTTSGTLTGSARIYVKSGSTWVVQGGDLVGTPHASSNQGYSVDISADGNTVAIGAPYDGGRLGAVWIFVRSGVSWSQEAKLVGTGNSGTLVEQGERIALSADGDTVVVGGRYDISFFGSAWVFSRSGTVWTQQGMITSTSKLVPGVSVGTPRFGSGVAISDDGNTVAVGGYADDTEVGAAWVFTRAGGVWAEEAKLVGTGLVDAYSQQGMSVALSGDGNTLAVGGPRDDLARGAVWMYTRSSTIWTPGDKIVGAGVVQNQNFGKAVSLSTDGLTLVVGGFGPSVGAIWIYTNVWNGVAFVWTSVDGAQYGSDYVGSPLMGSDVDVSGDGDMVVFGGPNDNSNVGAFWMFDKDVPTATPTFAPTAAPTLSMLPTTPAMYYLSVSFRINHLNSDDFLANEGALTQACKVTMASVLQTHPNRVYKIVLINEMNRHYVHNGVVRVTVYVRASSDDFTVLSPADTYQKYALDGLYSGVFMSTLLTEAAVFGGSVPTDTFVLGNVHTTVL